MSSDLAKYIKDIQLRNASTGRSWYWEKNAHRPRPFAYALEYNPVTLLLKTRRYIDRRRMLAPLMASNRPTGILRGPQDFKLLRDETQSNSHQIQIDPASVPSGFTQIDLSPSLFPAGLRTVPTPYCAEASTAWASLPLSPPHK